MTFPRSFLTAFRHRSKRYREAKLRPEFARLYPALPPNEWHPAAAVRCVVVNQSRLGYPRRSLPARVLDEKHFVFRGSPASERVPGEDRRMGMEQMVGWWE